MKRRNGSRDKIDTEKEKDLNHSVIKFISETCSLCVRTFSILLSMDYRRQKEKRAKLSTRKSEGTYESASIFVTVPFQFYATRNWLKFKLEKLWCLSRVRVRFSRGFLERIFWSTHNIVMEMVKRFFWSLKSYQYSISMKRKKSQKNRSRNIWTFPIVENSSSFSALIKNDSQSHSDISFIPELHCCAIIRLTFRFFQPNCFSTLFSCNFRVNETWKGSMKKATKQQMANFKSSLNHHHHNFLCRMAHTVKSTLEQYSPTSTAACWARSNKKKTSTLRQQTTRRSPSREPQKFD